MHVIVDDREAQSGIPECFRKMENTSFTFKRLPLGDYLVDDRLLVERKTMRDFAISLLDGRLFDQACRLSSSSYRSVYILEGAVSDLKGLNMRRESLQGAIISLTVLLGIPLLRSFSPEETARLMSYASIQMHRTAKRSVHRSGCRPKGKRKRQLYILQGLPGIGPVRAAQLLKTFGSVQAVFSASIEELSGVSGVGCKVAKKIYMIVN